MEPTPGTVRILFLGDSVTFGLGVAEEDSYPRVIEALLNGSRTDSRASVEVLNSAIPGYNTIQELAQLRELGLAFQPQLVVGYLYNDIEPSEGERNHPVAMIQAGDAHEAPSAALLARRIKSDINAGVVFLNQHSLFFGWLTPRLGTLLRPLGAEGFGQAGEIKDQYVDSNPRWRRVQMALLEMKRLCDERKIRLVIATRFARNPSSLRKAGWRNSVSSTTRSPSLFEDESAPEHASVNKFKKDFGGQPERSCDWQGRHSASKLRSARFQSQLFL
jgi:hypothetical protein